MKPAVLGGAAAALTLTLAACGIGARIADVNAPEAPTAPTVTVPVTTEAPAPVTTSPKPTTTTKPKRTATTTKPKRTTTTKPKRTTTTKPKRTTTTKPKRTTTTKPKRTTTTKPKPKPKPTTTTKPRVVLSIEQVAAKLTPTAAAWAAAPSFPRYTAMAAAAREILDSGDELPHMKVDEVWTVHDLLEILSVYPGNDEIVYRSLRRLSITGLPLMVESGNWVVGVDVRPGRYRTLGAVKNCYWETRDGIGKISENHFVNAAPQVIATVRSTDFAFNSDSCGAWIQIP